MYTFSSRMNNAKWQMHLYSPYNSCKQVTSAFTSHDICFWAEISPQKCTPCNPYQPLIQIHGTARIYGPGLDPDSCPCRTLIRDDISSSTVVHGCTCRKRGRYFVHRYRVSVRVPLHAARWAPSWRTFHRCCTHVILCGTGLTREYGTRMQGTHAS